MEFKSYWLASRQRDFQARGVNCHTAEGTSTEKPGHVECRQDDLLAQVKGLLAEVVSSQGLVQSYQGVPDTRPQCWGCGKRGHIKRNCWNLGGNWSRDVQTQGNSKTPLIKLRQASLEGERPAQQTVNSTPQVVMMTGELSHKGDTLTVSGNIDDVICPVVVDTGANVTVVRPDVLRKSTLSRLQGTMIVLKTATGDTANVAGKLWLGIKIGGTEVSHETLVADISDKFILGLDFLMAHGCTVDAGARSLSIGVEEVPLHKPSARQLARCYRLTAVEDTLISPYSETLVAACIMDNPLGEAWRTVGPSFTARLPPEVMVGKALVDAQQDYVPLRVVNLSGQPRTIICQGTEVASCEPVGVSFTNRMTLILILKSQGMTCQNI